MKKEYDFSSGERGKFYRENVSITLPILIEPENLNFIERLAEKNDTDISTVINDIIKNSVRGEKVL